MLHSVDWQLITDVSGRSIDPIFKDQAVQDGTDALSRNDANQILIFLGCLNLEDGMIVCTETLVTTNRNCVTSQEIKDRTYTAAKTRNHAWTGLLSCQKKMVLLQNHSSLHVCSRYIFHSTTLHVQLFIFYCFIPICTILL